MRKEIRAMREVWERETRALKEVIEALKEEVEGEKRERDEGLRANWQDLRELKERVQVLEIWRCDAQKQQHNESEEGILIVQKNFTCDLSFSKEESDALNDTIRLQYSWEQLTDEMEGKPETKEKGGQAKAALTVHSTSRVRNDFFSFVSGPLTSFLLNRSRASTVIFFGGILSSLGFISSAFASNIYGVFLLYGILCGKTKFPMEKYQTLPAYGAHT